jgi:hypothetical protein
VGWCGGAKSRSLVGADVRVVECGGEVERVLRAGVSVILRL